MKLSLACDVPGKLHGSESGFVGAATLPQPELPLLQHVLAWLAVQTQGLLLSPVLTRAYPTVYMSRLPAPLQYSDVLDDLLAKAS